jgi:flagellar biosynthetic protein FlhB
LAETEDEESKTEDPTEKRLIDAREKGNIPIAREMTLMGSIAGLLGAVIFLSASAALEIAEGLKTVIDIAGTLRLEDREAASVALFSLSTEIALPILLVMLVVAGGSIVATIIQNSPSMSGQRLQPNWSRVSPLAGWQRLFGKAGWVEFLKASSKLAGVVIILWLLFITKLPVFISMLKVDPSYVPQLLQDAATSIIIPVLCFSVTLAAVDFVWSRHRWRRELRMTLQELKEELKQAEGDPLLKARIRSIWRQKASRRMLEKVPTASVVITNPTHYAVALRYVREEGGAPIVVAKGLDHLAMKIREVAAAENVPLVENRLLARGLYEQVEVDEQIPPEFYHAVAEIILYLNRTGRMPARSRVS